MLGQDNKMCNKAYYTQEQSTFTYRKKLALCKQIKYFKLWPDCICKVATISHFVKWWLLAQHESRQFFALDERKLKFKKTVDRDSHKTNTTESRLLQQVTVPANQLIRFLSKLYSLKRNVVSYFKRGQNIIRSRHEWDYI